MLLGDIVQRALSMVGITEDRVKYIFGDCNCKDRKDRLNFLHSWARACMSGLFRGTMSLSDCRRHYDDLFSHLEKERDKNKG